jgi:hypothetical protein
MWAAILEVLALLCKGLVGRWANKDPEKERLQHELIKSKEAQAILMEPKRSKSDVLDSMSRDFK